LTETGPEVYVFDGDDDFAINESISQLTSRLGEPTIAGMNTTQLDGRTTSLAQLKDAVATVPFLASKRLVILTHPTARYKEKTDQDEFLAYLDAPKPDAKLVLVAYDFLTDERHRRDGKLNWLEQWAVSPEQSKRVYIRHHPQPSGMAMVRWIQEYVKTQGGQMTSQAAMALASQIGEDTRLAAQEIIKLLTYVNFSRPVEPDDVVHLTPLSAKIGDFDLVNAIRDRDQRKAQALLQRSLEDDDPIYIFQRIVSQIRALVIGREIHDERGTVNDFPKALKISYYPARLALEGASRFSNKFLDMIYHRLLELDESIKTGQIDADLALELLVIELTT
jgi:DNA polymerase-3 subunit delta